MSDNYDDFDIPFPEPKKMVICKEHQQTRMEAHCIDCLAAKDAEIGRLREVVKAVAAPPDNTSDRLTDAIRLYFKRGLPERGQTTVDWWPVIFDWVHLLCDRVDDLDAGGGE